jgi:archaellum component FlaC
MVERYLEQFEGSLQEIENALHDKPDHDDLEYQLKEIVMEITSKLEELHEEVKEVSYELEDVKFQLEYPPDRKG